MKKIISVFLSLAISVAGIFAADVSTARSYESKGAYVDAIITYCQVCVSDPWNNTAINGIKSLMSKLAKGDYGNKNYGVSGSGANAVMQGWKDMEVAYQQFLTSAIRYKLTYTSECVMEKFNDADTAYGTARFKPDFKFEQDYPAEKDIKSAFKKLQKSDFALAKAVRDYGKNVAITAPDWKTPPTVVEAVVNGIKYEDYAPKYSVRKAIDKSMPVKDNSNAESNEYAYQSTKSLFSSLKREAGNMFSTSHFAYHMSPSEIDYTGCKVKGYYLDWKPTVQIAVADRNGNRISNWTWWETKKGVEIQIPLSKAEAADHYIISNTWCMLAQNSYHLVQENYIDFNYKPQSFQVVKK